MTNDPPIDLSRRFAPKWTLRSVLLACIITLGLYLLLPYLETLSTPYENDSTVRTVDTAVLAPPPPPPPQVFEQTRPQDPAVKPQLEMPRQPLNPLASNMNLEMALGSISGDFSLEFRVQAADLTRQVEALIFRVGEVDQPPQPLARLQPVYPPRARMRRIEGFVVVEFIVAPDGTVREIEVKEAQPGDLFSDAAVRAIRRWKFSPGEKEGRKVFTRVRQRVNFNLQ